MVLPVAKFEDPWLSQPIKEAPWLTGIQKGVGLAGQLEQMKQKAAMAPVARELKGAQAELARAKAAQPFAGQSLPGQAGQVEGIEVLKNKYGPESSQVKDAQHGRNVQIKSMQQRGDYYGANVAFKYLPKDVKNQRIELFQRDMADRQKKGQPTVSFQDWLGTNYPAPDSNIAHSAQPTPGITGTGAMTPTSPTTIASNKAVPDYAKMAEQTSGIIAKSTSDAKIRSRALAANTTLKILNGLDVDNIAKYAGVMGKLKYYKEAGEANIGMKPSQSYVNYRIFKKSKAKTIADAARLILQTSQRGSYVYKMLMPLADPTMETWGNSQDEVKMRLNFMKNFMADYANSLSHQSVSGLTPGLVKKQQAGIIGARGTSMQSAAVSPAKIRIQLPDGRKGSISAKYLADAIKRGAKRI